MKPGLYAVDASYAQPSYDGTAVTSKVIRVDNEELIPPQASNGDTAHAVIKAFLSAVPTVGGPAAELFQYLFQAPLEQRRRQWMESVGSKLLELDRAGVRIEHLQRDEKFVSAVLHATHIALRTHIEEKHAALRNAITNIAIGQTVDETEQHLFFEFIDSFAEYHLRILRLFQSPPPVPGQTMGALDSVIYFAYPELRNRREICEQLWRDLYLRGLVDTERLQIMTSGNGLREKRTTALGDSF